MNKYIKYGLCLTALLLSSLANSTTIQTTLDLTSPYTSDTPNFDTVLLNWSTSLNSGTVVEANLTDWSISLFSGGTQVYQDNIVSGGVVNSIGGIARDITDIDFNFNLDTMSLNIFDNMVIGSSLASAIGIQVNVFKDSFTSNSIGAFYNGNLATRRVGLTYTSSSTSIPLPTSLWLIGFGFIGVYFSQLRMRVA